MGILKDTGYLSPDNVDLNSSVEENVQNNIPTAVVRYLTDTNEYMLRSNPAVDLGLNKTYSSLNGVARANALKTVGLLEQTIPSEDFESGIASGMRKHVSAQVIFKLLDRMLEDLGSGKDSQAIGRASTASEHLSFQVAPSLSEHSEPSNSSTDRAEKIAAAVTINKPAQQPASVLLQSKITEDS